MAINTEHIVPAGTARHGDHLCCAFDSPAQQEELVIDFVRARVTDAGADEEGVPWMRVTGEGDVSSMAVLKQALADARGSGTDVHIDASRLQFMDLSGARCLIDTAAELGPERRIVLHQPRRAVRRLFEILAEHGDAVELVA